MEDAFEQGFDDSKHRKGLQSGDSVDGSTVQYEAISETVLKSDVVEREYDRKQRPDSGSRSQSGPEKLSYFDGRSCLNTTHEYFIIIWICLNTFL